MGYWRETEGVGLSKPPDSVTLIPSHCDSMVGLRASSHHSHLEAGQLMEFTTELLGTVVQVVDCTREPFLICVKLNVKISQHEYKICMQHF